MQRPILFFSQQRWVPIALGMALTFSVLACDDDSIEAAPPGIQGFDLGPLLDFGDVGTPPSPVDIQTTPETIDADVGEQFDGEVGAIEDVFTDVCIPKCTGKACGPDGCGGLCGTCNPGTSCSTDFQCEINGDFCEGPYVISTFPTTLTLTMDEFANDFGCGEDTESPDVIIELRPGAGVPVYATVSGPGQLELSQPKAVD